jgi:TRAP-type mannitol/chloroaromatic compound transport system permease small subunit
MTALGYFLKGIDKLSEWTCKISSLTLILLMGVVIYNVLLRKVFHTSVDWTFPVTWMLWAFISVMALAWTQVKGEHISIDIIPQRLPPRIRAALDLILYALLCFFFLTFTVLVWFDKTHSAWRFRLMLPPPTCVIMAAITAGIGLLLLQCVAKFMRDLVFVIKGKRV